MHRSNSIIMNLSLLNKNLITGCNLRVSSSPQKVFGITGRYGCGWIIRIMIIYIMIIKNRNTAKNNNNNDDTDGTGDNNKAY